MNSQNLPFALTRPVHAEHVRLVVSDLDLVSRYYRTVIGLELLEDGRSGQILGTGGRRLLTLVHDPDARRSPREAAGLFHTAFLVPDRRELARWVAHAAELDVRLEGASDHLVSEAVYLSDPEGNGIEIYRDRGPNEWRYHDDGTVQMATERLNLRALIAVATDADWKGMADGTVIGHIHLQVGDVDRAESFYRDVMGLQVMARYQGASFFATGGYHHHLAANIWNSRGAGARPAGTAGLASYTLRYNDQAALAATLAAAEAQEIPTQSSAEGYTLTDPWGIGITLSP
ncbi:VOC family protein [Rhizobium halophilum]|uniref:VOC family protein n=1 Tax=Rhizobium halophilum TaxID=2846852 RepID=UPI001EFE0AEE|nr:VOC family protein [Rhizobium halophilum]MCF6370404.1 VOC family protein [Rhizobium halophilum]